MKIFKSCFIIFFILFGIEVNGFSDDILITFSGEELGNLEPCGCYEGQIGGITRRYTFLGSLKKQKNIVLPVSLGDLTKNTVRQEEIKMEIMSRALMEMDYLLHNLGEKDIEINPRLLSYLSQTDAIVLLSSNVEITAPFPAKINRYILKEYPDAEYPVKIAFLGILSKSVVSGCLPDYVNINEPVKALKPLIKKLKDKVNLIVLLSHAPFEESLEISKSLPEIGLIISGHNIEEPEDLIRYVNNTPVVSPGTGGRYIGVARYSINDGVIARKSVQVVPLDYNYKEGQKEAISLIKEYQQMLIQEDLLSKTPQFPTPNGQSYTGSFACGVCHKLVYEHWSKTKHAVSYNTLVIKGYQYDPECIKCHTTGYGYVSGFLNYEKDRHLINVGCEGCHGAGSEHINNVKMAYDLNGENGCIICHDSEHSPGFQFSKYWQEIIHPPENIRDLYKINE